MFVTSGGECAGDLQFLASFKGEASSVVARLGGKKNMTTKQNQSRQPPENGISGALKVSAKDRGCYLNSAGDPSGTKV